MGDTRAGRAAPVWAIAAAAWLGPAFVAALREYARAWFGGGNMPTWRDITWQGGDWLLCAFFTPPIFWLAQRYPLVRGAVAQRLPLHFFAALVFCVAWAGTGVILSWALFGRTPYGNGVVGWVFTTLPFGVAVYFAVVGAERATFYFAQASERETQAARLSAQLAEARLGALRMQMQPHFLFNSLNAITVIVRDRDTATATRMLEQLGEMLRRVMRTDRPGEVALKEELDFVRQYLSIEEVRFSDRLRPVFDIDPRVLTAAVPEFVLQPLVENAIRHGLAKRVTAGLVRIEARRDGNDLLLSVTDDGPGPGGTPVEPGEGVGLANTRERLSTLYGARASLTLEETTGGGARATIRIPWQEPGGGRG